MRRLRFLSGALIGLCLGLALGWLLWSGESLPLPGRADLSLGSGSDAVLVVVVETGQNVEAVRRAVAADRVVASSQEGIAVSPRRVVVTSLEHAGDLLTAAGWSDHPLEIIDMSRSREEGPDTRVARITSLINKPTLTLGEAHLLLDSM